jgi:hypothetical protein
MDNMIGGSSKKRRVRAQVELTSDQTYIDPNNLAALIQSANNRKNLKEIHRVAEVVQRISHDCLIVPNNSFKLKIGSFLERVKYYKFDFCNEKKEGDEELSPHEIVKKVLKGSAKE